MKKLTLPEWKNIAEIAGMIAVVISLIFVGLEIRQNTDQARTEAAKEGFNFVQTLFELGSNSDEVSLKIRGFNDFDSLNETEKIIFDTYLINVTIDFDLATELYAQGNLDDIQYQTYEELMASLLNTPGGKIWFASTRYTFPPDTALYYDEIMVKYAHIPPLTEYYKYKPVSP